MCSIALAENAVVARVNGVEIRRSDLELSVDQLIPRETYHGNIPDERRDEFRQKALSDLIDNQLEYQDAIASGIKPDRKKVKEEMERLRERYPSKQLYKLALERSNLTEDDLESRIERNLAAREAVIRKVIIPSRMSDDAFKAYYEKNLSKFKQPEQVKLKLISTRTESRAKEALERLQRGLDFADVAEQLSEDDYRVKGGDVGYIHRGRVLQEIEDVAFNLKAGETSGLIKAGDHWYVIRVDDKVPERQLTLEEASSKRKSEIETKQARELLESWLASLKAKAKIEILWKPVATADIDSKPASTNGGHFK